MVSSKRKIIGLYLEDIKVEEETGVKRLEEPYHIVPPKASYAIIDGKYFSETELLSVWLSRVTDFGTDQNKYEDFALQNKYNFMLCEAEVDIKHDKLGIVVTKVLDREKYDELLKIKRIPKVFRTSIKYEGYSYEPIFMYEVNELYYGAFLEKNNYRNEEPKIEKFFFEKKKFDMGDFEAKKELPLGEKIYIENELEKDTKKEYLNKLIKEYKEQKENHDKKVSLHEKELDNFKKENKDLITIINKYYQKFNELKEKYDNFSAYECNEERKYIDDLIIMVKGLTNKEKDLLKEVIASEEEIIKTLENIQNMLSNIKIEKNTKTSNNIGTVIGVGAIVVVVVICIVSIFSNNGSDEPNYNQEWCASKSDTYNKCSYSYFEGRCVCKRR